MLQRAIQSFQAPFRVFQFFKPTADDLFNHQSHYYKSIQYKQSGREVDISFGTSADTSRQQYRSNEDGNGQRDYGRKRFYQHFNFNFNFDYSFLSMVPFLLIINQQIDRVHCFFQFTNYQRNKLEKRVVTLQYSANNPIEGTSRF